MSKAVATLSWSVVHQAYEWSLEPHGETLFPAPDSPAWFAWLADLPSFAFRGRTGSFTARQERRERGEHYWYAYLRAGQQLHKKYLGKTEHLTVVRLEQIASLLQAERTTGTPHETSRPAPVVPDPKASLPTDPFTSLLSTKLHVPRPPARLVPRSRLIEHLWAGLSLPLILLSAPLGFGKTTLLAEWLAACQLPVAWLSLDAEDNDTPRFLCAVLAALQSIDPTLGSSLRPLLSSPLGLQGLSLPSCFGLLINEIASRDCDLLLVLDDYHQILNPMIQQALGYLVEHCPPHLHLVIATRADPVLPLTRLRARGQICELRAADLQFSDSEARHFLHTALSHELSASMEATILTRTEGWIAGLQLTALSLQAQRSEAEVQQFLTEALDTQRHLVDYLTEEVLSQQPEAVQAFLLYTSLLEPFSASLCAAVTEAASSEESADMLASLERANLFLFPLDAKGEWYRYHPLWASMLRVRLERRLGTSGVATLYGRASRWYEQHGLPAQAIDAAIQANEYERAAQLLEDLSPVLMVRGYYSAVRRWIEQLPTEQWRTRAILCVRYAWALFLTGQRSASQNPLEQAERLFVHDGQAVGMGLTATLRAVAAAWRGEGEVALAVAQEALALLPADELIQRSSCMSALGAGWWLQGDVVQAAQTFGEALFLHEQAGNVIGLMGDHLALGQVYMLQGKLTKAAATYQQVVQEAAPWRGYAIEAAIHLAGILYEWNDLEEAEDQLTRALEEANETADQAVLARGVLTLASLTQARLREAHGEYEAARMLLGQAMTLAEQGHHPRALARAQAWQVRWWLVQGEVERARGWYEAHMTTQEPMPTYQGERDALTEARVLAASGEAAEALRLLDGYLTLARRQGRLSSELRIRLLSALTEARRGRTEPAVYHLGQALALGEPAGYVRLFLDEGAELLPLLRLVLSRSRGKPRARYAQQLVTLLEAEHPEPADSALAQPPAGTRSPEAHRISTRELTVLRLLSEGLSTPQMAARLVVSPNTIKTQLASLYRKLEAHTREEALAQAIRLHLL